ncbi:MAG: hypothetical protein IKW67_02285 [Alphaproteobacteria bacterium]|nr:hypothetical protein [Alphaproteobacteria bacterium]
MKKLSKKFNFMLVGVMVALMPKIASAASGMTINENAICDLITNLGGLLKVIRVMAFIGAGFIIAQWAWEFIKAGDVDMNKVKDKGAGMLVGFTLLFMIGVVLSFLMSTAGGKMIGCAATAFNAW